MAINEVITYLDGIHKYSLLLLLRIVKIFKKVGLACRVCGVGTAYIACHVSLSCAMASDLKIQNQ